MEQRKETLKMAEVAKMALENTEQAMQSGKNIKKRHFSHFTNFKKGSVMGSGLQKITSGKITRMVKNCSVLNQSSSNTSSSSDDESVYSSVK